MILIVFVMIAGVVSSTVLAAPMGDGVTITTTGGTTQTGVPGSVVNYQLTVTNAGTAELTVTVSANSTGGWNTPTVVPGTFSLPVEGSQEIIVSVPIPATATTGQNDVSTVVFEGHCE